MHERLVWFGLVRVPGDAMAAELIIGIAIDEENRKDMAGCLAGIPARRSFHTEQRPETDGIAALSTIVYFRIEILLYTYVFPSCCSPSFFQGSSFFLCCFM